MPAPPLVRPRTADDLPALIEILAAQQPQSDYPFRWPLPYPAERFIARTGEQRAWVALHRGRPVGHVSVQSVLDDDLGRIWARESGAALADLACVSVLFVDPRQRGRGIGAALLDTAVDWAHRHGRVPVLDVVQKHDRALRMYRARGWRVVGQARPPWLPEAEPPVLLMALLPPPPTG